MPHNQSVYEVQQLFDRADRVWLFDQLPDVDALIEAIIALPDPRVLRFDREGQRRWSELRTFAQQLQTNRDCR